MKIHIRLLAVLGWALAAVMGARAADPLTTLNYKIVGSYLKVSPAGVAVPKGIAGSVMVEMANADGSTKQIDNTITQGAYVEAILRSPASPVKRLIGQVNAPLMLPALNVVGDYQLGLCAHCSNLRRVSRFSTFCGNVGKDLDGYYYSSGD